jgi:hypothetical protein
MTIDTTVVNLYTCCKCKHRWTDWDAKQGKDCSIPKTCPSCRNVRWNQYYTKEDKAVFEQLEDQHLAGKAYNDPEDKYSKLIYPFDFIAYDFLYEMKPQPDIFEIKQVLAIPQSDIEARHELMLGIIRDRISKKASGVYDDGVIGVGDTWATYHNMNDKRDAAKQYFPSLYAKYFRQKRCIMKGCKHREILKIKHALYPDADSQVWDREFWDKWLKLKEHS